MITLIVILIFIKNMGTVPKNKPIVVIPKARPGDFFNIETNIASVIDIVIEKNITPINDTIISESPIAKNGIASKVLIIATFLIPNKSDKIPPKALPRPIIQNK